MTTTRTAPTRVTAAAWQERRLLSESYVPAVLPVRLSAADLLACYLLVILWPINVAGTATGGMVSLVYWLAAGLLFFLPLVIAVAQLGLLFPHEGSLYTWTYKAIGPRAALFAGACYWLSGPMALVITAGAMLTFLQGIGFPWLATLWQQGLVMLVLIALFGLLSLQRIRTVHNVLAACALLLVLVVVLVMGCALLWLLHGHRPALDPTQLANWQPDGQNVQLFAFAAFGYLGVQVPLNLGGEIGGDRRRAITRHLCWGSLLVLLGYLGCALALLLVRGDVLQTSSNPNFELIVLVDRVLGTWAGNLAWVCLMACFYAAAVTYNVASARLLFVGAIEQQVPRWLAVLNRHRVPANAIGWQVLCALLFVACVYLVLPLLTFLGQPATLSTIVYTVCLAALTLLWITANLFVYLSVARLWLRARRSFTATPLLPTWLLAYSVFCGILSSVGVGIDALLNSWLPQIDNPHWLWSVGGTALIVGCIAAMLALFARGEAEWQWWQTTTTLPRKVEKS